MNDAEIITAVVMAVGLAGTIVPIVPGLLLVWGAALAYAFVEGWGTLAVVCMAIITVLFGVSFALGVAIPARTSQASGASFWGQLGGLLGAVVGFFAIPVVGVIVGAAFGIFLAEWMSKRDPAEAATATKGLIVGLGWSALANFGLGVVMVLTWIVWVFAA